MHIVTAHVVRGCILVNSSNVVYLNLQASLATALEQHERDFKALEDAARGNAAHLAQRAELQQQAEAAAEAAAATETELRRQLEAAQVWACITSHAMAVCLSLCLCALLAWTATA